MSCINIKAFYENIFFIFLICLPNMSYLSNGIFKDQLPYIYSLLFFAIIFFVICIKHIITSSRKTELSFSNIDLLVTLYVIYNILICIFINTYNDCISISESICCVLGYLVVRINQRRKSFLNALVLSGTLQSIIGFLQLAEVLHTNNYFHAITGAFDNPGPLGGFLAITLVVAFYLFVNERNKKLLFLRGISILSIGILLIITESRAGWVATIGGAIYFAYYYNKTLRRLLQNRWKLLCITVIGALCFYSLYNYKKDSADGRFLIWKVSTYIINENPVLGHGHNSFEHKYMHYQANYFARNPDSRYIKLSDNINVPFNEYIRIIVEQGLLGLLLVITIIFSVFRIWHLDTIQISIKAGFLCCLIFSVFSYTSEIFSLYFLLVFFIGSTDGRTIFKLNISKKSFVLALTSMSLIIVFTYNVFILTNRTNKYALKDYNKRTQDDICFYFNQNYPKLKNNPHFLTFYTAHIIDGNFELKNKIDILEYALNIIPSTDLACNVGNEYRYMKDYKNADFFFTLAHNMAPRKIYPLYCLFLLYKDNNLHKAKYYANKIISLDVKIKNEAYYEIITNVNDTYNKSCL